MNKKLSFKKLPPEIQNKLIALQKRGDDRFVFSKKLSIYYWIGVTAALLWFVILFSETQSILWEDWMFWSFLAATVSASLIFTFSAGKIFSFYLAKLKNVFVFTPREFLKFDGDTIESWRLKDIEAVRYFENGRFLEVWSGERQIIISVTFEKDAKAVENIFDGWKANAGNGLLENIEENEFAGNSSTLLLKYAGGIVFAILLGTTLSISAQKLNQDYDDSSVWKRAVSENSLEVFESYKKIHPTGKYASEADQKIKAIIGNLKTEYINSIKNSADDAATETLTGVLENITNQPERKIYVKISETRNLDDSVIQKLKKRTGLPVNPYYYSIPPNQEENRKDKVFGDLKQVFHQIAASGAISFERSEDPPPDKPAIFISYKADTAEIYYTFFMIVNGREQINYYPGAKFTFNFRMNSANNVNSFDKTFETFPTNLNTEAFDERDAANYSFEKVYFGKVTENFGDIIGQQFGLKN